MDAHLGLSVKLPRSRESALALPFTQPTGYGLGKSGWVSAKLEAGSKPSLELLRDWVVESYCAVAPKSLGLLVQASAARRPKSASKAEPKKAGKASVKRVSKTSVKPRARAKSASPRVSAKKRARKR